MCEGENSLCFEIHQDRNKGPAIVDIGTSTKRLKQHGKKKVKFM